MIVVDKRTVEFALSIAAIPVTIVILSMATLFTRRENRKGMVATIVSCSHSNRRILMLTGQCLYFAGMAYFIFRLVRMYQPAKARQYLPARKSLTTFAVITIILIVLTIIKDRKSVV